MRFFIDLVVPLAFAWLMCGTAHAKPGDINRCVGADGRAIFTDQPCEQLGATVRTTAPEISGTHRLSGTTPTRVHVRDCARTLPALVQGVQSALVTGDVNRLAGYYQWTGMGAASADAVLDRLQAIAARPFVSMSLLRARAAPNRDAAAPTSEAPATTAGTSSNTASSNTAGPVTATGIAIEQTRSTSDPTPVRTVLSVSAYMECWWVSF
ncbi:MAG: hypothetical protein JSR34_07890 [Proteobacteria bacterium]|nr:hypothetical protein [Pseudomonadota bacterium]